MVLILSIKKLLYTDGERLSCRIQLIGWLFLSSGDGTRRLRDYLPTIRWCSLKHVITGRSTRTQERTYQQGKSWEREGALGPSWVSQTTQSPDCEEEEEEEDSYLHKLLHNALSFQPLSQSFFRSPSDLLLQTEIQFDVFSI
ncbi:hypothetical protein SAY87_013666 [Trapa incisa]|uniref:Uncharacterized protein n=1 Tax=Trapa incisa TaxID=236973 RepID=A0AAN7KGN9_9MYRT|nr:hypothetical protein SAY87_013666 [Trapa incisa]